MKRNTRLATFLLFSILLLIPACGVPYHKPPKDLNETDLVGTWQARYGKGRIDKITIRGDGTFKQVYQDVHANYSFETLWNTWWLEQDEDGRILIHFQGGRYYPAGIEKAELEGQREPCPSELPDCYWNNTPDSFYDPFGKVYITMVGELILNIREDASGDLLFHHMWLSGDRGFALIGGEEDIFRRIDENISTP